jgi:uncharacterized phiE125 gp8 family phage protein
MVTLAELPAADIAATREAVKQFARIVQEDEDPVIDALAASALLLCESFCGQVLIARGAEEVIGAAATWTALAARPVRAIAGVDGLPAEGAVFPLPVEAYGIDIAPDGGGWVRVTQPGAAGRVRVRYEAGLASGWAQVPPPVAQGVVRLALHLFVNRDDASAAAVPPAAVAALWRPWQRLRLA